MADFVNKRYRLESEIGRGGMGVVYRATDRLLGEPVAVKRVFTPSEELIFASISDSVDRRLALAREFQTLASLWHPNIITVLDYGFDSDHLPYFTMDLLDQPLKVTDYGQKVQTTEKIGLLWNILQ